MQLKPEGVSTAPGGGINYLAYPRIKKWFNLAKGSTFEEKYGWFGLGNNFFFPKPLEIEFFPRYKRRKIFFQHYKPWGIFFQSRIFFPRYILARFFHFEINLLDIFCSNRPPHPPLSPTSEIKWSASNVLCYLMLPFHLPFCFHTSVLTTTKITPITVCPLRTTSGQCCSIPFTYKGVTYNSCTDADHHRLWCSLDSQYKGRWDYCRKYNLTTQWHHH